MEKFFLTILHSWGSDTPQEVFWALNDLITYAKSKGFVTTNIFSGFDRGLDSDAQENIIATNEKLIKELSSK